MSELYLGLMNSCWSKEFTWISAWKVVACNIVILSLLNFCGVVDHVFEFNYSDEFRWPPDFDVRRQVELWRTNKMREYMPINDYRTVEFQLSNGSRCNDTSFVTIFVRSNPENLDGRAKWRKIFKQFSTPIFRINHIFLVPTIHTDKKLKDALKIEFHVFKNDLLQFDYSQLNYTTETLIALQWAATVCQWSSRFFVFMNDEAYKLSFRKLFEFLSNLNESQIDNLYAGFTTFDKVTRSRWNNEFVSLSEYPFSHYPPYMTNGFFILSNSSVQLFQLATFYVKRFKFDDINIGILAKKLSVEPIHHKWYY